MPAHVLLDKWAARGCDIKVVAEIRKDVFDVSAPKLQVGRRSAVHSGTARKPPLQPLSLPADNRNPAQPQDIDIHPRRGRMTMMLSQPSTTTKDR
jgi:hypothetical protein